MKLEKKRALLQRRRWRIRKKVSGTAERPRLSVHFSNKHIYAQCIDDKKGHTLLFLSSLSKDLQAKANVEGAATLGKIFAEKASSAGIESVVFDRGGYPYHGRVKSLAEGAREGGLKF